MTGFAQAFHLQHARLIDATFGWRLVIICQIFVCARQPSLGLISNVEVNEYR